jgi:PAS domain S-box-containing protein
VKEIVTNGNKQIEEKALTTQQLLKYAADVATLYERERAHREALESVNRDLQRELLERKRLERDLIRSEQKYRSLFDDSREAIYITSRDGILIDANDSYMKLFGYTREEIVGASILDTYVDPSARSVFQRFLEEHGALKDFAVQKRRKDGSIVECAVTATVRRDAEGKIIGYQGTIRDMTEHKRSQQVLELARRMDALAHMAGGIAHEIRNPLAISSSAAQLLVNDKIPADQRAECAEKIVSAINRVSLIIENLLAFARPVADYVVTETDLTRVVLGVLDIVRSAAVSQNVAIKSQLDQEVLCLVGNAELLHRVFLNLMLNALAAMPHGGVLHIAVQRNYSEGVVIIMDSGPGIPAQDVARFFDPFFPGLSGSEGIGLGLSVAHSIVTQHGGAIEVDSVLGKGTTLRVSLPLGFRAG